jgi:hypothetical protein
MAIVGLGAALAMVAACAHVMMLQAGWTEGLMGWGLVVGFGGGGVSLVGFGVGALAGPPWGRWLVIPVSFLLLLLATLVVIVFRHFVGGM